MPKALESQPELMETESRALSAYFMLKSMAQENFSGPSRVTLKEIDLYLSYYPVNDVYYFIDLMREIDSRDRQSISDS